jgi:glycosyltransferase involved in cell wall biosynthesis
MNDQITIALPVYKRTDFIKSALDSAVNQTVACKILLIDNNSPHDEFKKIVEGYDHPSITYVKTENTVPQDENFNNCFRFSDTPWVTVLHDDDMLHHQYVEFSQKLIDQYKENLVGIIFRCYVNEQEWQDVATPREMTSDVRKLNPEYFFFQNIPFPAVLLKREIALSLGGFNNDLHPIADFDFWYRYSRIENFYYVNQDMAYFRISPTQSTNRLTEAMINNIYLYRWKEIQASKQNHLLTRLGLELSRINNIQYFKDTYPGIEIPEEIPRKKQLRRAQRLLSIGVLRKIVEKYIRNLSYTTH